MSHKTIKKDRRSESGRMFERTNEEFDQNVTVVKESDAYCICPKCGRRIARMTGQLCYEKECPECSIRMIRDWN